MKLLIIEKDPLLLTRITRHFRKEGFLCDTANAYRYALQKIENYQYDCMILDPELGDGDGFKLIEFVREDARKTGVIVISDKGSPNAKIAALNAGADDYLTKPINLSELRARVNALLRRKYNQGNNTVQVSCMRIELDAHTVVCKGKVLNLRKHEFHLFLFLAMNKNHIVPTQAIAEQLFDGPSEKAPGANYVYGHIKNLKRKLRECGCPQLIRTVYGMGYKIVA
jgi:DNA-binding response OmpR family regulator